MQNQLYHTLEVLEQLDAFQEWQPYLNQLVNSSSQIDFSNCDNKALLNSFFQECLANLKHYKATISSQEDILQSATDELISLREENSHLNEANQNLANQVSELKHYLNEADTLSTGLQVEVTHLKQEKQALSTTLEHYEELNKEIASKNFSGRHFTEEVQKVSELDAQETDAEKKINEIIGKQETLIENLSQEVEELYEYKKKCQDMSKDCEAQEALKEQNVMLQEEIMRLTEESRKMIPQVSENLGESLKNCESFQDQEKDHHGSNTKWTCSNCLNNKENKDTDFQNKNFLSRKSVVSPSPVKENVDFKGKSLLTETIVLTSSDSQQILLYRNGKTSESKQASTQKTRKELQPIDLNATSNVSHSDNFGSDNTKHSLGADLKDQESKVKEFIGERKDSRQEKEASGKKNGGEYCFDGMLSWEEGDFPQLGSPGIMCSPNFELDSEKKRRSIFNNTEKSGKDLRGSQKVSKQSMVKSNVLEVNEKDINKRRLNFESANKENKDKNRANDIVERKKEQKKYTRKEKARENQVNNRIIMKQGNDESLTQVKKTYKDEYVQTDKVQTVKLNKAVQSEIRDVEGGSKKYTKLIRLITFSSPILSILLLVFFVFLLKGTHSSKC